MPAIENSTVIRRSFSALLTMALLAALLVGAARAEADPDTTAFARGINIGDYLAYPEAAEWPLFRGHRAIITDADLERLANVGFTYIRLPVEPGPFLDLPPKHVTSLEKRLTDFVMRAQSAGLAVIVTGFARHETPPWRPEDVLHSPDAPAFKRYTGFLQRLAMLLRDFPAAKTALELMNEPQPDCVRKDGDDWTLLQRRLYAAVRETAPKLKIVLTTGCWSSIDGLETLDMAGYDRNTLVDFHFYEPFSFTHQGATWTLPELRYLAGLGFPAQETDKGKVREAIARLAVALHPGDRRQQRIAYGMGVEKLDAYLREDPGAALVASRLARVAQWADKMGVARERIILGEFGALRPLPEAKIADDGARAHWLETIRKTAEKSGFGWALWAYHSGFGLLANGEKGPLDGAMLRALGLKTPATQTPVNQTGKQNRR